MLTPALPAHLLDRIQQYAREWELVINESFETESSVISFVSRNNRALVLKVVKRAGDEWNAGEVLSAFDGKGMVRVYEHTAGAMLLERLQPGTPLVTLVLEGRDEEATDILAGVMDEMAAREVPDGCPTNTAWAKAFERYLATDGKRISRRLVEDAQQVFAELGRSQRRSRLLHGDLQHYNVLFDSHRGWLAIDPKGVIGEVEYEVGAVLRNPVERPDLFLSRPIIERRLRQFTDRLDLDYDRTLGWAFAQSVLSAIWQMEDGFDVDETNSALHLASILQPMLA